MMTKYAFEGVGKVAVLMGGNSADRELSLLSGKNIVAALHGHDIEAEALDVQEDVAQQLLAMKPTRAFIALHSGNGEEGRLQGLLSCLNIPYTGSCIAATAIARDSSFTKLLWQSIGIPTPVFRIVTDLEKAIDVMQDFGLPLCVKPIHHCGITNPKVTQITEPEQLPDAFGVATEHNYKVLIEPWIQGKEYVVGILGTSALPIVEIKTTGVYSSPSAISPEREQYLQELAFRAFQVTGCRGWGTVKLIEDHRGDVWFINVDTVPMLIESEVFPLAAKTLGISFSELVTQILSYSLMKEEIVKVLTA